MNLPTHGHTRIYIHIHTHTSLRLEFNTNQLSKESMSQNKIYILFMIIVERDNF